VVLVGHFSRKSGTEVWDNGDCISFGSARAVGDCCAADSFLADILQPWSFLADGSVTTVGSRSHGLKQNISEVIFPRMSLVVSQRPRTFSGIVMLQPRF